MELTFNGRGIATLILQPELPSLTRQPMLPGVMETYPRLTLKQSVEMYVENKIIANKQNTARSVVDQPADLTPVFKIIKKIQHTHTVRDIPVDRCPISV